jgi:multiple sugar transport system permease protein
VSLAVARRRRPLRSADLVLRYGPLSLAAVVFSLPVFWLLVTSLKRGSEFSATPLRILPEAPQWSNYQLAVTLADFPRFAWNSFFLASTYTVLVVATSALVGYGFARHRGPGRDRLFVLVLATMMVPNIVLFVPQFVLFARLELTNTYWPWILWALGASPFHVFLFRQFFLGFPKELEDAAEVDGAGPLRIFWQIFLPNSAPVLAASAIFAFLWVWSDYLYPILLLNDANTTLAVKLATAYRDPQGNPLQTVTMAGVVLYALPLVLVFFGAQRFIIRGIVTTGIRG